MTDDSELARFAAGMEVKGWGLTGFRGRGTLSVESEGIEFRLNFPFGRVAHAYVKRADLADVYPVQARRLSATSLVAAIVPHLSNAGIRFLTPPTGMFADRDVYTCFPDDGDQPRLMGRLIDLGYPVDRRVKTYRMYWGLEE